MTQPRLSEQFVLAKCDFFVDAQLWPLVSELNPRPWLQNFLDSEQAIALRLLDVFMYFSRPMVDQLFVAAFQQLSSTVATPGSMPLAIQIAWQQFFRDVIVTHVEGETPRSTDSGYLFARRARQLLGLSDGQIMQPTAALESWSRAPRRPLLFVDDFVGSGNQFASTWQRNRRLDSGGLLSFASAGVTSSKVFYCPLVATRIGLNHIRDYCPGVDVRPVHIVDSRNDGVLGDQSAAWSDDERAEAYGVIATASSRAGIPLKGDDRWDGYEGLGLAMAFEHSVPDATIPLYYWEKSGWNPLVRRR